MLALWITAALGADYTVDATAGPGGDGSAASPFQGLQDGLDAAQAGDIVHVLPGTYAPVDTVRDGTPGAPITMVAEPRRLAVVQADGRALDAAHTHHIFDGMVFDGGYGAADLLRTDGADGLRLIDVEVRRSGADCIDLRTVSDVRIESSTIHHCVADGADAHGVTGDGVDGLTIVDTEIYLVSGDAVQLSPPRDPWNGLVIEGCDLWSGALDEAAGTVAVGTLVGENALDTKVGSGLPTVVVRDTTAWGWRGVITNQAAFNIKEAVDVWVDGVTVYDSEIAFRLRGPDAVVRVHNAVIHDVDKAFRVEDALVDAEILHVTIGEGVAAAFEDGGGGAPTGLDVRNVLWMGEPGEAGWLADPSNQVVAADVFADAPGGDYHLVEGAAPVDAGVATAVAVDRDGVPRPLGPASDAGGYEWTDAPPPGTTTPPTGSTPPSPTDGSPVDTGNPAQSTSGSDGADQGCGCGGSGTPMGALILVPLVLRRRRVGAA